MANPSDPLDAQAKWSSGARTESLNHDGRMDAEIGHRLMSVCVSARVRWAGSTGREVDRSARRWGQCEGVGLGRVCRVVQ